MHRLDFYTLEYGASIIVLCTLLTLLAFWRKQTFRPGTLYWVEGVWMYALAFLFFLLRGNAPGSVLGPLITTGLVASSVWFNHSIQMNTGGTPHMRAGYAAVVASLIGSAAGLRAGASLGLLIPATALVIAVLSLYSSLLLFRYLGRGDGFQWRSPEFNTALAFLVYGVYQVLLFSHASFYSDPDYTVTAKLFLATPLFIAGLTFSFILTAYSMLEQHLASLLEKTREDNQLRERSLQDRWMLALENAKAGAWELNLNRNTLNLSHQLTHLLGAPDREAEFPLDNAVKGLHPDDVPGYLQDLDLIRQGITDTLDSEHRLRRNDGTYIWVSSRGKLLQRKDADSDLVLSGTVIDISESKFNQSQLEHAILEAQNARLAAIQASKAKSTFLANISHEIRTPMNAIMGFSQLLMDDPALTPKQRENLDIITSSSQHLLSLIEDVLNLSRIESGHISVKPMAVDPRDFFADIVNFFRKRPQKSGVEFQADIGSAWPAALMFDPKCVRQVCINLLTNAFKFTQAGSVSFSVSLQLASGQPPQLWLDVSDTGIGMTEEEQRHVFDAFVQTNQGANLDGYGLGLSICKTLITQMGGRLELKSDPAQGSHFRVILPVELAADTAVKTVAAALPQPGPVTAPRQFTLLIVDDIESNRKLLNRLLENSGFRIDEASTAKTALDMMRRQPPDLVLMDIRMPHMQGDEVIRLMKQDAALRAIPVIAITANAMEGERERLLELGASDFISKPFSRADVHQRITRILYASDKADGVAPTVPVRPAIVPTEIRQPPSSAGLSILVVDDNRANQQLLLSQLRHLGFNADVAANGQEGLDLFLGKRHALVFSDCNMPVMDGFEMTRQIRTGEQTAADGRHSIVVGITGSPEELRNRCFESGMDHVIGKPLLLNTLRGTLQKFAFPLSGV
ncbi:MAG TPA: response regulator [Candidatus Acidoferrum sp.]|nr:response regulator [Candidatus Acidoferrum sp.]